MIADRFQKAFAASILKEELDEMVKSRDTAILKTRLKTSSGSPLKNQIKTSATTDGAFAAKGTYRHIIYQRFLDMKFRGARRKKKYPIHMRIVMGHYNTIAYKLMHYYTDEVVQQIKDNAKEWGVTE